MNDDSYPVDGLIRNEWPRWLQREDGSWYREWTILLNESRPDEVDSAALGEDVLEVSGAIDGRVLRLVTVTREEPGTDEMFFFATFRLFRRVETVLGEIDRIQGQPRSMWRPFR